MSTLAQRQAVESELAAYAALIDEALTIHTPTGEPERYLYSLISDYPQRGGKRLRPALCLAACEAFGGKVDEALPSAVAIELLHTAFLIHDDIEDGSELRRGRSTLHAEHGVALALNAGDALAILGMAPLRANADAVGHRIASRIGEEFTEMARHTLEGQAMELGWMRDNVTQLTSTDYLAMVLRKTCWYTTMHPLRVGLLLGSLGTINPDRVNDFGFHLGAAFQIRDDVLNLRGDEDDVGKEILGDLLEGKRTLMLIDLIEKLEGTALDDLVEFLSRSRDERTFDEARTIRDLMEHHGSIDVAVGYADLYAARAHDTYADALGPAANTAAGRFLRRIIDYMVERET
ncbi:MAG: polyprenyl synthetase family protein [Actinomycetota bacterium]